MPLERKHMTFLANYYHDDLRLSRRHEIERLNYTYGRFVDIEVEKRIAAQANTNKNQRANTQSKRHKKKVFHQAPNKTVSPSIAGFINNHKKE